MNDIDVLNIKKEISSRKEIKFKDGGELDLATIKSKSTEELQKMVVEYETNKTESLKSQFKNYIQKLFDHYAEDDENVILLSECYGDYDGGRELYETDYMFEIEPISKDTYNTWCQSVEFEGLEHKEKSAISDTIENFVKELDLPVAVEYFEDSDSVNCYWHGYVGVTRDFKVITFICRDDDMMADRNEDGGDVYMKL